MNPQAAAISLAQAAMSREGLDHVEYALEALHEYRSSWKSSPSHWRIRMRNRRTRAKWIRPMRWEAGSFRLGEPRFSGLKPLYGAQNIEHYQSEPVTVVEGEWCVDRFEHFAGGLAVTSGGSSSANDCDWSPLAGKVVVLWPDKDAPGEAYMDAAALILREIGCRLIRIRVQDIPSIPEKGDCVDWFETFGGWSMRIKDVMRDLPTVRDA